MGSAIAYAIQVFSMVREAIDAGMAIKEAYDIITKHEAVLQNIEDEDRGVSPEEWDALNKESEDLRAHRPDVNEGE